MLGVAAAALAMALAVSPAEAVSYAKDVILTASAPTYNGVEDGTPPTSLSSMNALPYQTLAFTVSATGSYTLTLSTSGGFKPYLTLYSPNFLAASPLTNALAAKHYSAINNFTTNFGYTLASGTSYVAVLAGEPFAAAGVGPYKGAYVGRFGIDGPGIVTEGVAAASPAPEPATWALFVAGFGLIGTTLRARRRAGFRFA